MYWIYLFISSQLIVLLHEAFHFIAAKIVKCPVEKFSINFGPAIIKKKIKGTIFQIATIPLGGYCSIKGETEYVKDPKAFCNQRYRNKLFIIYAGVFVNIVTGFIVYSIFNESLFAIIFGYISIALGLLNSLPIPPLDGSIPLLVLLEKKYNKEKAYKIISKTVKISFILLHIILIALWVLYYVCN